MFERLRDIIEVAYFILFELSLFGSVLGVFVGIYIALVQQEVFKSCYGIEGTLGVICGTYSMALTIWFAIIGAVSAYVFVIYAPITLTSYLIFRLFN